MAEIKWIKITTDMFDNRKIKHLRRLPDGDKVVLIWVMLLTMAGRCNAGGMIFLTENIPYTPKMLADELNFEENTVKMALDALAQFNMVMLDDKYLTIAGWEEYQNIEGMERVREQTRQRVAKHREKKKLGECNVTVTSCNAIDIDKDKEKEIERDIDIKEKNNKKKKVATAPAVYVDNEELNEAIINFIQMRKQIKKPMTDRAVELMISKLNKLAGPDDDMAIKILEKSTMNCWTDIYPLDTKKSFSAKPNKVNWEDA